MITSHRPVVAVGIDPTSSSRAQVQYALDLAERRGGDLWVVSAYQVPPVPAAAIALVMESERRLADERARRAVTGIHVGSGTEIRFLVREAPVVELLRDVTARVDHVVLGRSHRSAIGRVVRGDIAGAVLARATCAVTVVPPRWIDTRLRPVVILVSGIHDACAALSLGFAEADARDAAVVVVHAVSPGGESAFASEEQTALGALVAGFEARYPEVFVRTRIVEGAPEDVLVDQSVSATEVIVDRPHATPWGVWHRSVARQALRRAACPVTVTAAAPRGLRDRRLVSALGGPASRRTGGGRLVDS